MKPYLYQKLNLPELVAPVLEEWQRAHKDIYYDISTTRERMSVALQHTRTYYLRSPVLTNSKLSTITKDLVVCYDRDLYNSFPIMKQSIGTIVRTVFGDQARLGRVFVTRLTAKQRIGRHLDEGLYFDTYHRFHIPLQSVGARFCWDNDHVILRQGDLWILNNSVPHWVESDGPDRTHLIFDAG